MSVVAVTSIFHVYTPIGSCLKSVEMPIRFLLQTTIRFPYFIGRKLVSIFVPKRKQLYRRQVISLPIAGLDENFAQSVAIALKREDICDDVMEAWLTALQLAQISSDRLLRDLHNIRENLIYWESSMQSRHHRWLMFIQRGPIRAIERAKNFFIESTNDPSATEMIEQRVAELHGLEKAISIAIASIYEAASLLRIEPKHGPDWLPDSCIFTKRAYFHVRICLTSISNALRRLRLEIVPLEDHTGSTASTSTRYLIPYERLSSFGFREDEVKHTDDEDASVFKELIAKITDRLSVDIHRPMYQPVHEVLENTKELSKEVPPLVPIPLWAQCPNKYQRHWIRYSLYTVLSFSVLRFLYSHSPLSGSKDMQRWASNTKFAIDAHVLTPLYNLGEEVFDTFHGTPSIVSREDYEISKESLLRMLKDFEFDHKKEVSEDYGDSFESGTSMIEGMDTLMRTYEAELKNPLWNLFKGKLARALLIQVQKLKVDTESAMLQLDQILRANELNVALVAAIPALFLAGGVLYFLFRMINRAGPDPSKSLIPCRLALIELQRALTEYMEDEKGGEEAYGKVLYRLDRTYQACWHVFKTRDTTSSRSEWPSLKRDFVDLAKPASSNQKILTCERMRVTYSVFQV